MAEVVLDEELVSWFSGAYTPLQQGGLHLH